MRLTVHVHIDPQMIRAVRKIGRVAAEQAGMDEMDAVAVEVALGESLTNAFFHAYGGSTGPVEIEFAQEPDSFTILVSDDGERRARPPEVPRALPGPSEPGRGLYLIARLMDEVELVHPVRARRGTAIRMVKKIRSHAAMPDSFHRLLRTF